MISTIETTLDKKIIIHSYRAKCYSTLKDMQELTEKAIMLDNQTNIFQKLGIKNITPQKKRTFFL